MFFCLCKKSRFLAAIILTLLGACTTAQSRATTAADLQPAVCRIHNRMNGSTNIGSGTLVDRTNDGREGLVLTCAHLFHEGVGEIVVTFPNGQTHGAKLVHTDRQADLAALAIANPRVEPAPISLAALQQGRLFACGYGPRGVYRCAVGPGIGEAVNTGQLSLMIANGVRSGDSGGGVFDEQGRLVAVIWGESQGVTYASYGRPLQKFLGRVLGRRTATVSSCPNGLCPRQQPAVRSPIRQRPIDTGSSARWKELGERVDRLEKEKQDRGDFVTRADLNGFLRGNALDDYACTEDLRQVESESRKNHATLLDRISNLAQASGASVGRAAGKATVGFLGLSGPAGWGILAATTIGGWLIGRRMKRRVRGAGGRRRRPFRS